MAYQGFNQKKQIVRSLYNNIHKSEEDIAKAELLTKKVDESKEYYDSWITKEIYTYNTDWEGVLCKSSNLYWLVESNYNYGYIFRTFNQRYHYEDSTKIEYRYYKEYSHTWDKFPIKYIPYIDYQVLLKTEGEPYNYDKVLTNHLFFTEELDTPVEGLKKVTIKIFFLALKTYNNLPGMLSTKLMLSVHIPENII